MWFAYLLACIPTIIGAVLWVTDRKVVWQEWAIATAIAFLTAGIFHATAILGMTADTETWSGKIYDATFDPEWVEEYTETYTTTDKKGNTHTHTRICHRTHYDDWSCRDNIGGTHSITPAFFADIRKSIAETERKNGMGDRRTRCSNRDIRAPVPCCIREDYPCLLGERNHASKYRISRSRDGDPSTGNHAPTGKEGS